MTRWALILTYDDEGGPPKWRLAALAIIGVVVIVLGVLVAVVRS